MLSPMNRKLTLAVISLLEANEWALAEAVSSHITDETMYDAIANILEDEYISNTEKSARITRVLLNHQ